MWPASGTRRSELLISDSHMFWGRQIHNTEFGYLGNLGFRPGFRGPRTRPTSFAKRSTGAAHGCASPAIALRAISPSNKDTPVVDHRQHRSDPQRVVGRGRRQRSSRWAQEFDESFPIPTPRPSCPTAWRDCRRSNDRLARRLSPRPAWTSKRNAEHALAGALANHSQFWPDLGLDEFPVLVPREDGSLPDPEVQAFFGTATQAVDL